MNKSELIEHVATATSSDKASAGRAVEAMLEGIAAALEKGDSVALAGFGTFDVRHRAARTGRNPATGESIEIAASTSAGFKPAAGLKRRLG